MNQQKKQSPLPLITIAFIFAIFGFLAWANSILIPYFKIACQLSTSQSYLVATAYYIAFTIIAIPSSILLRKVGYKKGMSIGLFIMAIGAALFIPAAGIRNFNLFLTGLFLIGSGTALLQTAVNPYATVIGPIESAAKRISIMGICNKIAGVISTFVLGTIILGNTDGIDVKLKAMDDVTRNIVLNELSNKIVIPYIIITIVLILFAIAILFSSLPDIKEETAEQTSNNVPTTKTSIFQFPHLLLGVLALFIYVGVEVIAADTIINYGVALGIPLSEARHYSSITLGLMLLGYLIGIFTIPKYISQSKALKVCAILGVLFTVFALISSSFISIFFIACLGFANSLMWPAIFPMAIDGLGKFTKTGSALLIMAVCGGAILPPLYGNLAGIFGERESYALLVPFYLFILYFASIGYKAGKAKLVNR